MVVQLTCVQGFTDQVDEVIYFFIIRDKKQQNWFIFDFVVCNGFTLAQILLHMTGLQILSFLIGECNESGMDL